MDCQKEILIIKMRLFRLDDDYSVVPEQETVMLIPEFKALWSMKYNANKKDSVGRKRYRARKELVYLYFYCDYRSEYSEFSEEERHIASLDAAELPQDYRLSKELQSAKDRYIDIQETRELRLLKSAYDTIDKLRDYFNDVEVTDENATKVLNNLGKIGEALAGIKRLEEQARKYQKGDGAIRGNQETGLLD